MQKGCFVRVVLRILLLNRRKSVSLLSSPRALLLDFQPLLQSFRSFQVGFAWVFLVLECFLFFLWYPDVLISDPVAMTYTVGRRDPVLSFFCLFFHFSQKHLLKVSFFSHWFEMLSFVIFN